MSLVRLTGRWVQSAKLLLFRQTMSVCPARVAALAVFCTNPIRTKSVAFSAQNVTAIQRQ